MLEHDVLDDRKPQARAALIARAARVDAIETLKKPRLMFRRHTGPVVLYAQDRAVVFDLPDDVDAFAFRNIFDGVVHEVHEDLLDPSGIGTEILRSELCANLLALRRPFGFQLPECCLGHLARGDDGLLQLGSGFDDREIQ